MIRRISVAAAILVPLSVSSAGLLAQALPAGDSVTLGFDGSARVCTALSVQRAQALRAISHLRISVPGRLTPMWVEEP